MLLLSHTERKLIVAIPIVLTLFAVIYWTAQIFGRDQQVLWCNFRPDTPSAFIQYFSKSCNAMKLDIYEKKENSMGPSGSPVTTEMRTYLDGYSKLGILLLAFAILWCVWIFFDELINALVTGARHKLGVLLRKPDDNVGDYVRDHQGKKSVVNGICLLFLAIVPRVILFIFQCKMMSLLSSFSSNIIQVVDLPIWKHAATWSWLSASTPTSFENATYLCNAVIQTLGNTRTQTFECEFVKSTLMMIGDQMVYLTWLILFTSMVCVVFGMVAMTIKVLIGLFSHVEIQKKSAQIDKEKSGGIEEQLNT